MSAPTSSQKLNRQHPVDEVLPIPKLATYGFQHVVAFYAGAVLVPIIIAGAVGLSEQELVMLITADLFTCGIASIIQAVGFWKIGVRLPLLQGVTFAGVSPIIAIGLANGGGAASMLYVYGAVIVAGIFTFLIAPIFIKLLKFFPPVVTGTLITIIGLCLVPVGALDAVTNPHTHEIDPTNIRWFLYALGTIAIIVAIQRLFRGFLATIAVLLGLVIGCVVAYALGDMNFDKVGDAAMLGFTPPFLFGMPKFDFVACLTMIIVLMITAVESTGSTIATGEIVGKRVKPSDIGNVLRADGVATAIGGVFNSFPYTAFSENVGLVRLTGVKSRWVVAAAGVIMILLGFLPKVAAVVASIPNPVLGGAALTLFATVAVVGIQTLGKVDFTDHRNLIIVTTSLALALWVTSYPDIAKAMPTGLDLIFGSGISIGAVSAILLNIVFFHTGSRGPRVAGGGSITLDEVNSMTRERFTSIFGHVVQDVPWAIERAFDQRPFADTTALREAFQDAVLTGSSEQQHELLNAFHDLGAEDETGQVLAVDHVALSNLDEDDHNDVVELATAYREHFGFPLIICARETERFDRVLRNGWSRMDNSPATEKAFALIEAAKIANYRFTDLVADANPIAAARFSRFSELS
ncbi:solute carrier family 23 protein [Mycolicibacterium confluentis]|uniref:Uracil-xanthine permease n=1 Tax=Mycolicibacterium confluentis TaxID=28047 RepID=A0A7I7Y0N8_9MYCO|nr:solute carrier family 23 protein [Mycolicibacterium confluentis]MCV7319571.1 purine/pyrimidine permease [Mycolicibacterium confluentis]ORV34190.1 xanthine permease [Mycolicibacterium confluentis]BBZ34592.1 uracil-xanthine permease [Mycolicibacterium confluentis]